MTMSSHEDVRANLVSIKIVELEGKVFTDQTGRFPINSSRGNKYVMVMYDNDTNAILAEAMKSRTQDEMVRAQAHLHGMLTKRGFKPHVQILDNECPAKLEEYLRKQQVNFQLVPPHLHRTNAAERAIGTFKDHFIAGLASADPAFPMHLWCRMIPHATTTLNLLRPSRINPKVSAEVKQNAFSATGHKDHRARNTSGPQNMGASRRRRLVHRWCS